MNLFFETWLVWKVTWIFKLEKEKAKKKNA